MQTSGEPSQRQGKLGEWKQSDDEEKRVVTERKDLFDITREEEKRVGQEANEKGFVVKKAEAIRERQSEK